MNQAWELLFEGKIEEAKKLVSENFSLETCKDYDLLNLMGYIKFFEKDYKEALLIYQNYLDVAISSQDKENEHIGYHQLAMVYREMNDYQTALSYIEKEREVIEDSFSEDALKSSVNNYEQGYLRFKIGEIEKSIMYMEQSLKQALQTDDLIAQACSFRGLGEIYSVEKPEKSQENFLQAIDLFEKAGDQVGAQEVKDLLIKKKQPTQATFLKFFVNIRLLWFIDFYEGLNFKCWKDLIKFLVIAIANLSFNSHPGVIFVLISVSSGQKAKNS